MSGSILQRADIDESSAGRASRFAGASVDIPVPLALSSHEEVGVQHLSAAIRFSEWQHRMEEFTIRRDLDGPRLRSSRSLLEYGSTQLRSDPKRYNNFRASYERGAVVAETSVPEFDRYAC